MREIRRRTRETGIFPNEPSCGRMVGAALVEHHETRQIECAGFMRMEEY